MLDNREDMWRIKTHSTNYVERDRRYSRLCECGGAWSKRARNAIRFPGVGKYVYVYVYVYLTKQVVKSRTQLTYVPMAIGTKQKIGLCPHNPQETANN